MRLEHLLSGSIQKEFSRRSSTVALAKVRQEENTSFLERTFIKKKSFVKVRFAPLGFLSTQSVTLGNQEKLGGLMAVAPVYWGISTAG